MSEAVRKSHAVVWLKPFVYLALCTYLFIVVYPMLWLLYTSLKTDREIFLDPFSLPALDDLQWINFTNAWTKGFFGDYFFNSVLLTVSTVCVSMVFASMAAYALARFNFPGVRSLFFYFLAGLMVPLQLAIVPLFFQMRDLGLLNSHIGMLTVYVAFGMPFAIFILTGFFKSLPSSLHESALIDGAGELRAFWSIMLPLSRPGLITVGIFSFLSTWNEFFMAFMFLSGEGSQHLRTLPLGLANITIVSQYRSDWGMAFAGLVLIMAPTLLVYSFLQQYLTKGITVGALKG
ncbi:MAG: carbohydrate ABC transporter permease [Candidatus Latescibacterota bacterium]|jgi:N-acetylglucosamine transport system permease protein